MTADHARPDGLWTLIIPVKATAVAKTRLSPVSQPVRAALALAFALDVATAALSCPEVGRVIVVSDDTDAARQLATRGAEVIPDGPGGGQNAALLAGFSHARRYDAGARVAALSGDLPSLRAEDLTHAFTCGAGVPRWFVADADGLGTTMLAVESGRDLSPCFGPRSRHEHRLSGAVDLAAPGLERLRRDVDTVDHLWQAVELGVGSHTQQTLRELGLDSDSQRRATDIA